MIETETQNNGMPTMSPVNIETATPKPIIKLKPMDEDLAQNQKDDDQSTDRDGFDKALALFDHGLAF